MHAGPLLCFTFLAASLATASPAHAAEPPKILVHYMAWFVGKPTAPSWGWHWTMNQFDPDAADPARRRIASHYRPLIGPYDSSDPTVLEYHLLLMKLAGIDGVIVDWYGLSQHLDYPLIHRNTVALFQKAGRLGLSGAVCYEDQTIRQLVEAKRLAPDARIRHVREEITWLRTCWFTEKWYLRHDGRPVLLSFGNDGLTDAEWAEVLPSGADALLYLSEHRRRPAASGAFDWPIPAVGLGQVDRFLSQRDVPLKMPAAYPRFHDIYAEAKVHASYGAIADDRGRTFEQTLTRALTAGSPFVQVVTWNDWGEGTNIEPSVEFGYRDLETLQSLRRKHVEPGFAPKGDALRLAHRLFVLRRRGKTSETAALDAIAEDLAAGRLTETRAELARAEAASR
ncbi:MAG: glycoside hydrolase family 71/99-like protein [Isosphaeraceae bacterium]